MPRIYVAWLPYYFKQGSGCDEAVQKETLTGLTTLSGFFKTLIYNLSEFEEPDRVNNQKTFWTSPQGAASLALGYVALSLSGSINCSIRNGSFPDNVCSLPLAFKKKTI